VELEKEDREVFLGDSQLSKEDFKDKVILDAGCGMGRYTKVVGIMGREVVGVDISQSVVKAYLVTHDNPSIHILQGNILHLPFREKQFDIIYSLGVLHHTPNAKQSFLNLVRYLKHGGFISVWVYGTAGTFSDFKTNPLRKERQHYVKNDIVKRMHWRMVYVREVFFNTIRLVTTRMYVPLLYLLCYPLAVLGRVPLLKYVTASVHQSWRVRVQENFDWLSPQYQSHHTKEEIRDWFREAQVEELSILPHGFIPKVGLKGKLR
jgi:ubiquinone/menaquinone biosynthesis C-methylase UbiE